MARIHIIAPHRTGRSPSQRYRLEQYIPHLRAQGHEVLYARLLDVWDDRILYSRGHIISKGLLLLKAFLRRWRDVMGIRHGDTVLLHREAFMTRGILFERMIRRRAGLLIFDLDDAIWLMDVSEGNRRLSWLKDPAKTDRIIALADRVIAGNAYIAEHCRAIHSDVACIPTVIDTERYQVMPAPEEGPVVIGWTGSRTSTTHLVAVLPMLRAVHDRWEDRIRFRVISDIAPVLPGLPFEHVPWDPDTEPEDLAPMHIGIMPMPDDAWSRGKCGFKGLQYMAMGKAVVLSDVGVNSTIVHHGHNGFLARSEAEWMEAVGRLVEDADLRRRLGAEARSTVEQHWSLAAWRDAFLERLTP